MGRLESLWLAFEKFAIFFSFVVTFILVMVLLVLGIGLWKVAPALPGLRDGTLCPLLADVDGIFTDLGEAVITRTISISQTIPVVFDLPLNTNTNVVLTDAVVLNRPTTMTLPGGGGRINGTVSLSLPTGQQLPVHLSMTVPVRQNLPVQMDVPVSIPLKETDLGPIFAKLEGLLMPYLDLLSDTLRCGAQ
jgi:hypothetical protein